MRTSGSAPKMPVASSPTTISGTRAVRSASQPKIGSLDETRRRPGRDDEAEGREVDALLGEVERQDGQQAAEAEPDDELGEEQGRDAAPLVEPEREAAGAAGLGHGVRSGVVAIEPIARA